MLVKIPFRVRERITEWVPDQRMAYELLDGMRVHVYKSEVSLRSRATGPLTALVLSLAVRDACKRLAKAAST